MYTGSDLPEYDLPADRDPFVRLCRLWVETNYINFAQMDVEAARERALVECGGFGSFVAQAAALLSDAQAPQQTVRLRFGREARGWFCSGLLVPAGTLHDVLSVNEHAVASRVRFKLSPPVERYTHEGQDRTFAVAERCSEHMPEFHAWYLTHLRSDER
jgi:hypothetical protein